MKMKNAKKIMWAILRVFNIAGPVQLKIKSALNDDGWFNSFNSKCAVDKNNEPIPWWTYSFIDFFEPRLKNNMKVFEYGCGNSTLWMSSRVQTIYSVENDKSWFDQISKQLPANAKVIFRSTEDKDAYAIEVQSSGDKFSIVIIDGRDRVNSIKASINCLMPDGIIVFDNSDREFYQEGLQLLSEKEFKRIDFWGIGPVTPIKTCTSLFYKDHNCLGI